jgi:hypothetical protein
MSFPIKTVLPNGDITHFPRPSKDDQVSSYVIYFGSFLVLVCEHGYVLVMESQLRKTLREMAPEHDRVLIEYAAFDGQPMTPEVHKELLEESLKWMPKEEVT